MGLSPADAVLMEHKAQLSKIAVKAIKQSKLTVNEIVKLSGIARSKVSAIKNGAVARISIDLFVKVISAAGARTGNVHVKF
ncbi:MAG: hypothetical protein A2Z20_09360 [Bdellovibrionales bacterium RBG_16_40_8]|nr:MAG: hypothetical protein A2Z20_09360 [Bdellovibrionales bacterium RBG_16_40_8]